MKRNINEAAGDLFRANLSRFGQGFKNIVKIQVLKLYF